MEEDLFLVLEDILDTFYDDQYLDIEFLDSCYILYLLTMLSCDIHFHIFLKEGVMSKLRRVIKSNK